MPSQLAEAGNCSGDTGRKRGEFWEIINDKRERQRDSRGTRPETQQRLTKEMDQQVDEVGDTEEDIEGDHEEMRRKKRARNEGEVTTQVVDIE